MWIEFRSSVRRLLEKPLGVGLAVVSLAIGAGGVTAVFSLANRTLFQPPPGIAEGDDVVALYLDDIETGGPDYQQFWYEQVEELGNRATGFEGLVAFVRQPVLTSVDESIESVTAEFVSERYFETLGVQMTSGVGFAGVDSTAAVISYRFWRDAFGSDTEGLGRVVSLSGQPFTVTGITSADFVGTSLDSELPDVWLPLSAYPILFDGVVNPLNPTSPIPRQLSVLARLGPRTTLEAASAQLDVVASGLPVPATDDAGRMRITALPIRRAQFSPVLAGNVTTYFGILLGVSTLLLLAACFNFATLSLDRSLERGRVFAIQRSLGARQFHVGRQIVSKAILVCGIATLPGLLAAWWFAQAGTGLVRLFGLVRAAVPPAFDARVFGFVIAVVLLVAVFFGVLPALGVLRRRLPVEALRETNPSGPRCFGMRYAILVLQATASVVMCIVGGLYLHSFVKVLTADPGHVVRNLLLLRIDPVALSRERIEAFYPELLATVASVPGVRTVASSSVEPLAGNRSLATVGLPGSDEQLVVDSIVVSPGYFQTLGIPLAGGTEFPVSASYDTDGMIINTILAQELFSGRDAVGRAVRFRNEDNGRAVIGVARQENCWNYLEGSRPCVYRLAVPSVRSLAIVVRTMTGDAGAMARPVTDAIRRLDPDLAVYDGRTFDQQFEEATSSERLAATVGVVVAATSILLAGAGTVVAFSSFVNQSRKTIAVEMALGATSGRILRRVLFRAAAMSVAGAVLGVGLASILAPFLMDQLYQTRPTEPVVFVGAVAASTMLNVLAGVLPARAAARTQPATVLRSS